MAEERLYYAAPCRIVHDDEFRSEFADGLQPDPSKDAMQRWLEELADTLGSVLAHSCGECF